MRSAILGLVLVALAACGTTTAERPLAVQTTPRTPAAANDPGLLFWSPPVRAHRFARLEDFYAGLQVSAAPRTRALPQGTPLAGSHVAAIERHLADMGAVGLVILHDGKVRHRWSHDGSDVRWTSFSVAKSFTSTLLGAAVKDGALALSDPVTKHLPGLAGTAYDGVTVEQIATMTSGVRWNEDYTDPNSDVARMLTIAPVAGEPQSLTYAKTLTREAPAGSKWVYKTLETNLLGDIVAAATGQSLAAYAKTKIVDPAGFGGPLFWMVDRTGANIGGCCISLRLSDYARMGQWVLEGGQPSVPVGWFEQAGGKRVDIGGGNGYGYQWWSNPIGFGAQGIFGQYITIVPAERLVIAVVSNHPTATGRRLTEARNALWRAVAEAAKR